MVSKVFLLIALTLLPLVELRLSIPVGILIGTMHLPFGISISGMGFNPILVFILVVSINILLGFLLFNLLIIFDKKLIKSRFNGKYLKALDRGQRRIKKYVDKYGTIGLALFIGIPLPGSGVYTGALGGFALGMNKKDFYKATIFGVLIAGIIVTILTLTGMTIF